GGHPEVWKAEPGNAASLVQVTHGGGWAAEESPDGSRLYFLRGPDSHGLYSMPVPSGAEILVAPTVGAKYWGVARKGVYFIDYYHVEQVEGVEPVKIYRFDT